MPLTFGIPIGLGIVLLGSILFFVERYKKIARIVIGAGVAITILALGVSFLMSSSPM